MPLPSSTCHQPFPPVSPRPPCAINTPGNTYYVSASAGDDANDGTSPATAFAGLCAAIAAVPSGNTLRVAEGTYADGTIYVDKSITVLGGYDPTFTTWDPEAHPSVTLGRLILNHGGAIWAGFDMRSVEAPFVGPHSGAPGTHFVYHQVRAGSLLRNTIIIDTVFHDFFEHLPLCSRTSAPAI